MSKGRARPARDAQAINSWFLELQKKQEQTAFLRHGPMLRSEEKTGMSLSKIQSEIKDLVSFESANE